MCMSCERKFELEQVFLDNIRVNQIGLDGTEGITPEVAKDLGFQIPDGQDTIFELAETTTKNDSTKTRPELRDWRENVPIGIEARIGIAAIRQYKRQMN